MRRGEGGSVCNGQGLAIDIGGENFKVEIDAGARDVIEQDHRIGVGLFPRRTSRHPKSEGRHLVLAKLRHNHRSDVVKGFCVPKETRHADEEFSVKVFELLRIFF